MEESYVSTHEGGVSHQFMTLQKQIEAMKKQMNRVSDARPIAGCQFSEEILSDELPFNFKSLTFEYDGITDPYEHLVRFENAFLLHRYCESVKYRIFLTTLSKATRQWFSQLGPSNIH